MFKSKLLWRVAVIILIAAFSIATIVSCGGDAPTQSTSLSTSVGGGASSDNENSDGGASDQNIRLMFLLQVLKKLR